MKLGFVTLSALLLVACVASAQTLDYILGPGDIMSITLRERADLSGKYVVQVDGTFVFPVVGTVQAGGLSVSKVQDELRRRLADGYFNNPQVSIGVDEYRSQRFFVIGEVARPGHHPLTGIMTLLDALAVSGPVGQNAGDEIVVVRPPADRAVAGPTLPDQPQAGEVFRVDLEKLQSGLLSQGFALRSGDTVFIPKAETIYVFGEVRNPGAYPVKKTTTVLQALALAGGTGERGSRNRIRAIRLVNGEKKELRVELHDVVQPNDTIIVPERWF